MNPASPVHPGEPEMLIKVPEGHEDEMVPLPAVFDDKQGILVSRWELTDEERQGLINGGSVYLMMWTMGHSPFPVLLTATCPFTDEGKPA